jgi:hypothetical protein
MCYNGAISDYRFWFILCKLAQGVMQYSGGMCVKESEISGEIFLISCKLYLNTPYNLNFAFSLHKLLLLFPVLIAECD